MLNPIWEKKGYDVLQGGDFDVSMLEGYDRYIMMGHGSPGGLFSVGQFHTQIQQKLTIQTSHQLTVEGQLAFQTQFDSVEK